MYPVLFELGPIQLRFYSLMYMLAVFTGYFLLKSEVRRKGIDISNDDLITLLTITVLGGIVGARIYYVIFNWDYFGRHLADIPAIWKGGLASHGGFIAGFLVAIIYLKKQDVSLLKMADSIVPLVVLGEAFVRFGNFMNGEVHGIPTTLPWGIVFPETSIAGAQFPNTPIHPTMLYQMFYNSAIFLLLWAGIRKKNFSDGFICFMAILLYSVGRFFIEGLRADSLYIGPFRTAQVMSLILAGASVAIIYTKKLWRKTETNRF